MYCLNLDYLQVNALGYLSEVQGFTRKKKEYGSRQFSEIWEYYMDSRLFATCQCKPHSGIINEKMIIIKFANEFLYWQHKFSLFDLFLASLQVSDVKLSRLDICCDFQHFIDYPDVQKFIFDFLNGRLTKRGKAKYSLIGSRDNGHSVEYLRFGSKTSPYCTYLYNKSKELREVKEKHYIRDVWQQVGFDEKVDVWRLEVSITEFNTQVVDKDGVIDLSINYESIKAFGNLALTYSAYIDKGFNFVYRGTDSNLSRAKRVQLIDYQGVEKIIFGTKLTSITDRSDKILVKKIEKEILESTYLSDYQKDIMTDMLLALVVGKDLIQYYEYKIGGVLKHKLTEYQKNQHVQHITDLDNYLKEKTLNINYDLLPPKYLTSTYIQKYLSDENTL